MLSIKKHVITTYNNQDIIEYTITQKCGFSISIQNYGGVITKIMTPDKHGKLCNVVLSSPKFDPINKFHLGAITGRVAGRIRDGKFKLNNQEYQLNINNGPNHIHGGNIGFNQKIWNVTELINGLELSYTSLDKEENYPGNLSIKVSYLLENDYELTLKTELISDKDSIANLTNHSYFDLNAGNNPMGMELMIDADYFAPIDTDGCVINKLQSVDNTIFDLRAYRPIKDIINSDNKQIKLANGGYDHPFVLNTQNSIMLIDKNHTGITLNIITDEPCVIVYTSNWLEPQRHIAVCLETQKMPNAINWDEFRNSVIIKANELKTNITKWKFGVNK